MTEKAKKINKRIDQKYITYRTYESCWGSGCWGSGNGLTEQTYAEYGEAEAAAKRSAMKACEEVLIYQAIKSVDPTGLLSQIKVSDVT